MKRHLHVACAIIEQDNLVLATQRSATMSLPLKWEFPGGKIEAGESAADCLKRELLEELGINITVGEALASATHSYGDFTVTLYPFICRMPQQKITLHEHAAFRWSEPQQLTKLDWAAADLPIIASYQARLAAAPRNSAP